MSWRSRPSYHPRAAQDSAHGSRKLAASDARSALARLHVEAHEERAEEAARRRDHLDGWYGRVARWWRLSGTSNAHVQRTSRS
jgi:hypothetical protein